MQRKIQGLIVIFILMSFSVYSQENRSLNGTNNNLQNKDLGAAHTVMNRITDIGFEDGFSTPTPLPQNPRYISNHIFSQLDLIANDMELSDFVWVFGQFIDHDISLTSTNSIESMPIPVPAGDEVFTNDIPFTRSIFQPGTGTSPSNPRAYTNEVTTYIDGSQIYGSDVQTANWIRLKDGSGKLKTSSQGRYLPYNTIDGEFNSQIDPNAPFMDNPNGLSKYMVAGDARANENLLLLSLHTVFVKEHNRMCEILSERYPNWDGNQIYERARKYVGAYLQSIIYNEWLPAMGVDIPNYTGYDSSVDPGVSNLFSTAAFRIGHTLINGEIIMMDDDGEVMEVVRLTDSYFQPDQLVETGIDPLIKGMATQMQQELDCKVVDDLRNFLFGPGSGLDLVALNIMRGREKGLPDYNTVRSNIGLAKVSSFDEINSDEQAMNELKEMYGSVDSIDAWVGMLSESHLDGKLFGRTVNSIIESQFKKLRLGDRFYYLNDAAFTESDKREITNISLHDILMRNTNISLMQEEVFRAMDHNSIPNGVKVPEIQLSSAIYPNPINNIDPILKIYAEFETKVDIKVVDYLGQLILEEFELLGPGQNEFVLPIADKLVRGIYFVVIDSGTQTESIKIIKE